MEPVVSVIIVSWNVKDLLSKSLASLFTWHPSLSLEVFVVDNASSDGSVELVRKEFPHVHVIARPQNGGFARANNEAIELARGRYSLLVNPDTEWTDDSLARMVAYLDTHPDVGVVGPKLIGGDGTTVQFEGARLLPLPFDVFCEYSSLAAAFPRSRWARRYLMVNWDHEDSRQVECLSGSCLLIRREVLEQVGDLDEGYPFNFEDVDWCHRVGLTQWRLHYLAETRIVHLGRQSIVKNRGLAALWAMQGVYRYYGKFHGRRMALLAWLLLWPVSVLKLCLWVVVYVCRPDRRRFARDQAKAFWQICWLSPWPAGVRVP